MKVFKHGHLGSTKAAAYLPLKSDPVPWSTNMHPHLQFDAKAMKTWSAGPRAHQHEKGIWVGLTPLSGYAFMHGQTVRITAHQQNGKRAR